jgi:hypothetical protein
VESSSSTPATQHSIDIKDLAAMCCVIDSIEERNVRAASAQKIGKELSSEGPEKTGRRRWLGGKAAGVWAFI